MRVSDVFSVKECNRRNLPENYHFIMILYMASLYENCCFVAENARGDIVGYAMAKIKDQLEIEEKIPTDEVAGYVMSVAVDKSYRKKGLGKILLAASLHGISVLLKSCDMERFKVYLNVRPSNVLAINMYKNTFGFTEEAEEPSYYSDGESAFLMSRVFCADESK